jgi:hypothetical protein
MADHGVQHDRVERRVGHGQVSPVGLLEGQVRRPGREPARVFQEGG